MKVGFLARTLMITEKYWNKLQDKADCWWAVTQKEFYEMLIENNPFILGFSSQGH